MAIVINGSGTVTGISAGGLPDGTVDTDTLAADAVNGTKLADDAINSEHYVDASIDNAHLADDAVGVAELSATGTASSSTFLRGDNAWAAAGITEADQQRLTTAFNSPNDGVSTLTVWERPDTDNFGKIGTGMSHSSGIWTFPSTGYWLIMFTVRASSNADARYIKAHIDTTTDNSTYSVAASGYSNLNPESSYWYANISCDFIFDCENTSTHKVRFQAGGIVNDVNINANTDQNTTFATFIKLGDT